MNPFTDQRAWLQRRYDDCLRDLGCIERAIGGIMDLEFASERATALTGSLRQASGLWRQMAHIAELMEWTDVSPATFAHSSFREWRAAQLERIDRAAERAGRNTSAFGLLEVDIAA